MIDAEGGGNKEEKKGPFPLLFCLPFDGLAIDFQPVKTKILGRFRGIFREKINFPSVKEDESCFMSFLAPCRYYGGVSPLACVDIWQSAVCGLFLPPFSPSLGVVSFTTVTQAARQHEHWFWKNTTAPEPSRNVKLLRHKLFFALSPSWI